MSSRFLSLFGLMLYDVELYFFLTNNKSRKTSDLGFFAVVNPLGLVYSDDNGG